MWWARPVTEGKLGRTKSLHQRQRPVTSHKAQDAIWSPSSWSQSGIYATKPRKRFKDRGSSLSSPISSLPPLPSPFPTPGASEGKSRCFPGNEPCLPRTRKARHQHWAASAGRIAIGQKDCLSGSAWRSEANTTSTDKVEKESLQRPQSSPALLLKQVQRLPAVQTDANDLLQLQRSLNLPPDVMAQAVELFQRHAKVPQGRKEARRSAMAEPFQASPKERLASTKPHLTEEAFRKLWAEMSNQVDREDDTVVEEVLKEAFRHAGPTRELSFNQFAVWFSSRSFSEEVSLDKEGKELRDMARKHAVHHMLVEKYSQIFNRFDTDGNGTIDVHEFEELLCQCVGAPSSIGLPQARVQHLFHLADKDGDKEIQFEEFLSFYKKYLGSGSTGFEDFYRFGRARSA